MPLPLTLPGVTLAFIFRLSPNPVALTLVHFRLPLIVLLDFLFPTFKIMQEFSGEKN